MGINLSVLALGVGVAGVAFPVLWPRSRRVAWILLVVGILLILFGGGREVWPLVLRWPFESLALFLVACLAGLCILQKLHYEKQLEQSARQHTDVLNGIAEGIRGIESPSPTNHEGESSESRREFRRATPRVRVRSGSEIAYEGSRSPVVQQTVYGIMEKVAGCTDHETERLLAPMIGKWLPIEGPVKNASTSEVGFYLTLYGDDDPWIACGFEPSAVPSVEHLSKGDLVRLIGRITIITKRGFTLDQCEVF